MSNLEVMVVMGNLFSSNPPMLRINGRLVRSKEFATIETYKDVLRIAGIIVPDDAQLVTIDNVKHTHVFAYEKFQIVDGLRIGDKSVFIQKMYGRR